MKAFTDLTAFAHSHLAGLEALIKAGVAKEKAHELVMDVFRALHKEIGTKLGEDSDPAAK